MREKDIRTGKIGESRFVKAALKKGFDVVPASRNDNMHKHIDFYLYRNGMGGWGIDVKTTASTDIFWCEFKTVYGGPGWLYGDARLIGYEVPELGGFAIVDRQDLAEYCEAVVEDVVVEDKKDAYKKKYTRRTRLDVITCLRLEDIQEIISYRVWEYAL